MATAKTGSFYLTETVMIPALAADSSRVTGTISLAPYVNVAGSQAIAIDQVDVIHQVTTDYGQQFDQMLVANGSISAQLTDLNPGGFFVRADNPSLVASSGLNIDQSNNVGTMAVDVFPDNFGTAGTLSEMFMVVNDTLYFTAGPDGSAVGTSDIFVTVRCRARVVRLGSKDWMSLALQSSAADSA
jgi:hypothetical protein